MPQVNGFGQAPFALYQLGKVREKRERKRKGQERLKKLRRGEGKELYFILGFNVESASHFERLGAFGRGTYHWKGVDERFRTVVRTCL